MRIKIIFHKAFDVAHSDDAMKVMLRGEVAARIQYEVMVDANIRVQSGMHPTDVLNELWHMTQNDLYATGWRSHNFPGLTACRSSMVGDVFMLDGVGYVVQPTGFKKIDDLGMTAHFLQMAPVS